MIGKKLKKGGDKAIQKWIDEQFYGKSCAIVLIGENTAGRKWINYEIKKAWNDKKGLFGIHIHNLKDKDKKQSFKGKNPFGGFIIGENKKASDIIQVYDPPYLTSTDVYDYIKDNLEDWVEEAISIRNDH